LGCNAITLQNLKEASKPVLQRRFDQPLSYLASRNPQFVGRKAILQEVWDKLCFHATVALSGLGGMGKTQTALEFAHRHRHEYQAVLWCLADTTETLTAQLANLVIPLKLPLQQQQDENLRLVLDWFATHSHWLLILDNADEIKLLKTWLPQLRQGKVLVTTRAQVTEPLLRKVALSEMEALEAASLLWDRATDLPVNGETWREWEQARALAKTLGYLPLALDQAGAYIREANCSFARYAQLFEQFPLRLLNERGELPDDSDHPDPVAGTWLLSFEKVKQNELAVQVLYQCAFLHAEGIVQEIFAELDPIKYDKAIAQILRYSLLKRDDQAQMLSIHRLVQMVLRAQLSTEEQKTVVTQVVVGLTFACPDPKNSDFMAWIERGGAWLLNARAGEQWSHRLELQTEAMGALFHQMGYYLHAIGDYPQALPLVQEASEIFGQVLGKLHPDYAQSLNGLAELYRAQGQYEQALPLHQEASEIFGQVLGKLHPDYATSLDNLANLYRAQGQYEQALPLSQEALKIREQVLGKLHPDYASSLNNLALLYYSQGQYEQALPLYQGASEIYRQVLGKLHPDYALSLHNLAALYRAQGQYEQALPLFQEALRILTHALGEQHPHTKIAKGNYEGCLNRDS
jgi:tetratricopeptide (TPR) repeat protein